MIEGLSALPWFKDAARRGSLGIEDCETCMKNIGPQQRQALACGYLPRDERVHLTIWQPPGGQRGYQGPPLETCAGYSVHLPEVMEAAITRAHWKNGETVAACGGEMPTEDLMNSILILDAASSELEGWLMTPAKDGGGGGGA